MENKTRYSYNNLSPHAALVAALDIQPSSAEYAIIDFSKKENV